MAKRTYEEVTQQKHFYRNAYRRASTALLVSCTITVLLSFSIYFTVASEREPVYYASQSAGLIRPLTPLDEPNTSSQALLAPDPPEEMKETRQLQV